MSNTDSFIDEVTEEVRKDKLFAMLRKYGWIGVVLVIALVGGAAFNEVNKSKAAAKAQEAGDALLKALGASDAEGRAQALSIAPIEGDAVIVKAMLEAGELHAAGKAEEAIALLAPFTTDAMLDPVYRDLAILKTAMIGAEVIDAEERIAQLAGIAAPGAPYRLLAEEQIAAAQVELGETDVAIEGLRAISEDSEVSNSLRQRALQMMIALGGDPLAGDE